MDVRTSHDFSMARRNMVVPQDPEDRAKLLAIDRKTQSDTGYQFGVYVDRDWGANTIANCAVSVIISWMATHLTDNEDGSKFNFYNLFGAFVTVKKNDDAEKEGNINIAFTPGRVAMELIDQTIPDDENPDLPHNMKPEDFFSIEGNKELNELYLKMDRQARYELSQKYGMVLPDKLIYACFSVTYVFIRNIFQHMLFDLGRNPEKTLSSVNFNDIIEFHCMRKGDGIVFALRPGMNAKLLIKSDELTEDELD